MNQMAAAAPQFPDFPLFHSLLKQVTDDTPLSPNELDEIINVIRTNNLSSATHTSPHETIYGLVRAFYLCSTGDSLSPESQLPYGGKSLKTGLKFRLDTMPVKLQKILLLFVRLVNQ